MTPLIGLSEFCRSLFSLWAFSLILVGVFSIVRSAVQRRYRYACLALPPLACSYLLWQVLFDAHLFPEKEGAAAVSRALCGIPYLIWILFLSALTAASLAHLAAVIRYGKRSITPDAVKTCLDQIPCGVCCCGEDGMVLFSNLCMNRLCLLATGERLTDGKQLGQAAGSVLTLEGRKWRFSDRVFVLDKERLREIKASDVTAEYAKTEALRNEKEELSRLKGELKKVTLGIDDTVRRREILQAKVNIHDEMNRLVLSTVASLSEGPADEDRILALWEQNALLLCMEADRNEDPKEGAAIEKLAQALKIRLSQKGDLPDELTGERRRLFFAAAQEALTNAAKHAEAKQMEISFVETDREIVCLFANDGKPPAGEVRFAGGLSHLSLLAQKAGAALSADVRDGFVLKLSFPNKTENQPHG